MLFLNISKISSSVKDKLQFINVFPSRMIGSLDSVRKLSKNLLPSCLLTKTSALLSRSAGSSNPISPMTTAGANTLNSLVVKSFCPLMDDSLSYSPLIILLINLILELSNSAGLYSSYMSGNMFVDEPRAVKAKLVMSSTLNIGEISPKKGCII